MRILAPLLLAALAAAAAAAAAQDPVSSGAGPFEELRALRDRSVLDAAEAGLLDRAGARPGEPMAVVDALDGIVEARLQAERYTGDTREIAEHAVLLRSRLLTGRHPSLLSPLMILGYLYHVPMELEAALDTYRWALRLSVDLYGPDSAEAARTLATLGNVEVDLGDFEQGERHLRQSVEIAEELYYEGHPRAASTLFRLAKVLFERERYEEARAIWERTRETYERLSATATGATRRSQALQAARSIHNLGQVHHRLGEIPEAFEDLQEALRRRRGEESRQAASSATALAELWHDSGDFTRAEEHYRQALEGIERWFGKDADRYAGTMSNLGLLLEESGDWEAALEWQRDALSLRLTALDTEQSPLVGRSRSRLGALLLRMGDDQTAEAELRRALETQKSTRAPGADIAETLTGLARIELLRGRQDAARGHLVDAVEILRGISSDHPAQILPSGILAGLEPDPERVARDLETVERLYGPGSVRAVKLLYEKARLQARTGDLQAALDGALAAEELRREHVRATIHSFPERQALAFVETRDPTLDLSLAVLSRLVAGGRQDQVARVWDAVIRTRALVLDAVISRHRLVRARRDPGLEHLAADLSAARERLAGLYMRGGAIRSDRKTALIREASRRVEHAERDLASASEPFLRDLETRSVGLESVTRHLAGEDALVGIVRFEEPAIDGPFPVTAASYLAFAVRGGEARARLVVLGAGVDVDRLVERWRLLGDRGIGGAREPELGLRRVGRQLRSAVWDPIARELGTVRRVFLVPDGGLNLINFAALPLPDKRYLVEQGPIFHLLTTERDLVELAPEPRLSGRGLLALGGVDFDRQSGSGTGPGPDAVETEAALTRGWSQCQRFASHKYSPLPKTAKEVEEIAGVWGRFAGSAGEATPRSPERQRRLTGDRASEASFKRLAPGYRVLHLATHGFSLEARCEQELGGTSRGGSPTVAPGQDLSAMTGLVLAGANRRHQAPADGDGMLTASEISSLDLSGVEWAVLSACNTGIGEVLSGEGTFGLRRAFAIAGARTVIMSLWRVDDDSTRKLMRRLYELRHRRGLETAEALHRASLALLRERRAASISTHPVFWGAFVASGDWR